MPTSRSETRWDMGGAGLERKLSAVMGRMIRLRLLRWQALAWLALLFPAIVGVLLIGRNTGGFSSEFIVLLVATLAGSLVARLLTQSPSITETARLVEREDPELNDAVITAVQVLSQPQLQPGVLSQMAVEDAEQIVRSRDWSRIVPRRQVFLWTLISTCSFLLMVASVMAAGRYGRQWLRPAQMSANNSPLEAAPTEITELVVEPGDTDLELGSALTVVARFPGTPPDRAALEFTGADGLARELAMSETVDAGVFAARMEDITQSGVYRVRYTQPGQSAAGNSSRDFQLTTWERPRLLQLDAVVTPPAWSGRPEETFQDILRLTVAEGSDVLLKLKLNKPVTQAELRPEAGMPLMPLPTPSDATILETRFTATSSTTFLLHLTDADGRTPAEETQVSIRVTKNEPAVIKALFPGRDTSVSALQEFQLKARASDDFGLLDYGVEFTVSGGDSQQISLRSPTPTEQPTPELTADFAHQLDLESLKAAPDDVVVYSFWAVDRAADGSERRTSGDLLFAEVRRFEEIFREGQQPGQQQQQQQQQQQGQQQGSAVDEALQLQKEIISATWNVARDEATRRDAGSLDEDLSAIAQSQRQAIEQLRQSLEEAPQTPQLEALAERAQKEMQTAAEAIDAARNDPTAKPGSALPAEQRALQTLLKMRAAEFQVRQQQQQQQSGGGGGNSASQQQLQQLELDNNRNRYESERQAQQQQEADSQQREQLQVLNRLKELARRQQMVNERLKQLESELRAARTDQEREELERELKRLRDEQREMLRDVDELNERMQQQQQQPGNTQNQEPQNRQEQQQIQQQMQEARSNVQRASQAMDEGRLSEAIAEGTRAERQFEELREDFRNSTSSRFDDAVRDLRQQARELNEKQQELSREIAGESPANSPAQAPSLRSERNREDISKSLQQQQDRLNQVLDQSRNLIQQAEQSEPLLSERLYETLREVREQKPQEALEAAEMLAERGLWPQTQEADQIARNGLQQLQQGIEQAADAVLGSETEALRRAQTRLQQAAEQLEQEVQDAEQKQGNSQQPGQQPDQQPSQQPGQRPGQQPDQQPGQQPSQQPDQQPDQQPGEQSGQQPSQQPSQQPGQQRGQQSGEQPGEQPGQRSETSGSSLRDGGREGGRQAANNAPGRPLTGNEFSEWSDQLRDVEEMLEDPELRNRVAQVRDRARAMRAEFRRHGTEPQWNLVRSQLLDQMQQLEQRLEEELRKRDSSRPMVPIDREPVPEEFDGPVQRYYELLGQERTRP